MGVKVSAITKKKCKTFGKNVSINGKNDSKNSNKKKRKAKTLRLNVIYSVVCF